MSSSPLKIAVTGAAGLVGTGVVQKCLDEGHNVLALDQPKTSPLAARANYQYQQLDATNFEAFKAALDGCDALIHLAAVYNNPTGEVPDRYKQHVSPEHLAMRY